MHVDGVGGRQWCRRQLSLVLWWSGISTVAISVDGSRGIYGYHDLDPTPPLIIISTHRQQSLEGYDNVTTTTTQRLRREKYNYDARLRQRDDYDNTNSMM